MPPVVKQLDKFECPHKWRFMDYANFGAEGNNVRMLPHAAFELDWVSKFPGAFV